MMKNKYKNLIAKSVLCLLTILASTVLCYAEPVSTGSNVIPFNTVLIKFGITMGAVLLSILVILIGLSAFKKFTTKSMQEYKQQALYGDSFRNATTMDDAIISFIDKNRL